MCHPKITLFRCEYSALTCTLMKRIADVTGRAGTLKTTRNIFTKSIHAARIGQAFVDVLTSGAVRVAGKAGRTLAMKTSREIGT